MILSKKIITVYKDMLNDSYRNSWFKKHIQKEVKDKTFADIGSGTGILSAYALDAGASHGYLIETSAEAKTVSKYILEQSGHKDKITCVNDDFKNVNLHDVQVIIAEQVGPGLFDELQLEIWQQANKNYSNYISIPDELSVDLYVYQGNRLGEVDNVIHNDPVLPENFYAAVSNLSIQPDLIIKDFISVEADSCDKKLENILDLSSYQSATLVFVNKIGFKKDYLYLNQSPTQNWKYPPRLYITNCNNLIRIFWNSNLSNKENPCDDLYKGYWDFETFQSR
jgi:predicted RNA methylase